MTSFDITNPNGADVIELERGPAQTKRERKAAAKAALDAAKKELQLVEKKIEQATGDIPAPSLVVSDPKPDEQAPDPALLNEAQQPIPPEPDKALVTILGWKRPYNSIAEMAFLRWLSDEIKTRTGVAPRIAVEGNIVVTMLNSQGKQTTTLFSCHTDTVHASDKNSPQKIAYDPHFGHLFLDAKEKHLGDCLGADDGAGIWLMLEMLSAKVPGTYIFHRGEERHGIGSFAMLAKEKPWLEKYEVAIAFDRMGTDEVITHQGGLRCCSEKFAKAFATRLNKYGTGFSYKLSQGGSFTDTKVYRGVIAECVNMGVGYSSAHSSAETLDYAHLCALRDACVMLEWDSLPVDRDPAAADPATKYNGVDYGGGYSWQRDLYDANATDKKQPKKQQPKPKKEPQLDLSLEDELLNMPWLDILDWVEEDPSNTAAALVDLASEVVGLRAKIKAMKGVMQ